MPAVPPQEVSPDPDPAEPEAPAAPPQEVPPDTDVSPAEPEAPVALPQESATDTSGSGNGGQQPEPAVVLPAEIPVTFPPLTVAILLFAEFHSSVLFVAFLGAIVARRVSD